MNRNGARVRLLPSRFWQFFGNQTNFIVFSILPILTKQEIIDSAKVVNVNRYIDAVVPLITPTKFQVQFYYIRTTLSIGRVRQKCKRLAGTRFHDTCNMYVPFHFIKSNSLVLLFYFFFLLLAVSHTKFQFHFQMLTMHRTYIYIFISRFQWQPPIFLRII